MSLGYLKSAFPSPAALFMGFACGFILLFAAENTRAQALNGNYTIGGSNPNFLTINAAVQQLDSVGVSGPVTFSIRNGTYPEVLFIDSVSGASATNTITFRSESGDSSAVVINGTTNSVVDKTLWLNRVAYMRFHQLTFRQLPSVHNRAVVFVGRGHNITLSNCVIWGTGGSTSTRTIYAVQGACDSNYVIENCVIRGANEGIVSAGSSFPVQQRPIFRNNHIFGITTDPIYVVGGAFAKIIGNRIEAGGGSSSAGIRLSSHSRAQIVGNRISVLSGAQGSHGIQIISSGGWPNEPLLVANNEINFTAGNSPSAYGIRASGAYHYYAHNTVRMNGGVYSIALTLESTSNCRLFNNVLVHEGTLPGNHALHLSINSQDAVSNYNNLYTAGPNLTPIYTTLAAYQAATGRDSLSVSVPPQFISTSVLVPNAPALMNSGLYLPEVPTDITGWLRNNPPDLGAYEQLTAPAFALGPDTSACDSFVLSVPAQTGTQWLWSTGDTLPAVTIRNSGTYWLQGTNSIGISRDTVVITIVPLPATPVITRQGSRLLSSAPSGNQWYLNDSLLLGETSNSLQLIFNGRYRVVVSNGPQCSSSSAETLVQNVSVKAFASQLRIWPNPAINILQYEAPMPITRLTIVDLLGKTLMFEHDAMASSGQLDVQFLPAGLYILQLSLQNGGLISRPWVKR